MFSHCKYASFFMCVFDLKSKRCHKIEENQKNSGEFNELFEFYQWSAIFSAIFCVNNHFEVFSNLRPTYQLRYYILKSFSLFTSALILCPFALQVELPRNGTVHNRKSKFSWHTTKERFNTSKAGFSFHFVVLHFTWFLFFIPSFSFFLAIVSLPVVFIVCVCVCVYANVRVLMLVAIISITFSAWTPPTNLYHEPTTAISLIKTI